ncbi:MAG: hypothetical protein MMC23_005136 [Stictis urceolatum]|nr:hypothetical protein [Stictis urceolata]
MELAPQSYAQSDLDVFFEKVSSHVPSGTAPVVNKVNGGYFSNETGPAVLTESNLDLEYAMSLSYPQNVTVYQVGDSSREDRATNNNFLDAIDGTYCTYEGGDNTRWDAQYPHNSPVPMDGLYNGTNMCGTYNATSVITISYGRNENASPESYNERECHEYMKLGLMGVTVLFSSGDSGVAGFHGECLNEDGSHTERASKHGRFNPMFPASCPFVTSVGGTAIPENGTVYDKEIAAWEFQSGGGFSNQFLMPDYQQKAVQTYYQRTIATWFDSLCYGSSFQSLLPQYGASRYNNSKVVRGFPDVSMNGQYYLISVDGDFHPVSGTSASAPVLGALITVLNGLRIKQGKKTLGFLNHIFYQNPGIVNDIVEGNNPGCGTKGFDAVPGWDPVTGLGTVDYERMKEVVMKLP